MDMRNFQMFHLGPLVDSPGDKVQQGRHLEDMLLDRRDRHRKECPLGEYLRRGEILQEETHLDKRLGGSRFWSLHHLCTSYFLGPTPFLLGMRKDCIRLIVDNMGTAFDRLHGTSHERGCNRNSQDPDIGMGPQRTHIASPNEACLESTKATLPRTHNISHRLDVHDFLLSISIRSPS